jgi:hypothetical protein
LIFSDKDLHWSLAANRMVKSALIETKLNFDENNFESDVDETSGDLTEETENEEQTNKGKLFV